MAAGGPLAGRAVGCAGAPLLQADGAAFVSGVEFAYRPSLQSQHLALFASLTALAFLAGYWLLRTRRTRGARLFVATLLLAGLRTGSDVVHALVGELWTFLGLLVAVNPLLELGALVAFVRFAGRYAGVRAVTGERATRGLAALLAVAAALVATNPWHGLVFTGVHRVAVPFTYVGAPRGPLGFALLAANAALLVAGAGLLATAFTTGERTAWWPAALLSLALSQALVVGVLQLIHGGVLPQYDYGALGLGAFVLVTTVALVDHGLRRIEVIARDAVLDEIADAVVLLAEDGTVVDCNAAARRLFGHLPVGAPFADRVDGLADLLAGTEAGRREVTIEPTAPAVDRSTADAGGAAPDAGDAGGTDAPAGTETAADASGEATGARDYVVTVTRVRAPTDAPLGYAVRFVDVTGLKERSRELARTNEQLDQFASRVSHDLRNPLNVAMGFTRAALDSADPAEGDEPFDVETALEYLERVDVSIDRMNAIIDDVLALLENADPVTETERVDFAAVAAAAWRTVDARAATMDVAAGGRVEADRDRLQRLLENLFRNAVDHAGDDVAIETGVTADGFYVADDGPGVPPADRERVFEHGYTTGDDGTGLGLSIVAQLAEAHGWTVALDPDHDGARFVVTGCETDGADADGDGN